MLVRIILVGFAVLIDALDFVVELFCTAFGSTAVGAIGGCAAGAQIAGSLGCKIGGLVGAIAGAAAQYAGAGEVIGAVLGYVLCVCITFSFGMMLVMLLTLLGFMSFKNFAYTAGVIILKLIPLLGMAPGWTKYAWDLTGNNPTVLKAARENNILHPDITTSPEMTRHQMQDIRWYGDQRYEQTA